MLTIEKQPSERITLGIDFSDLLAKIGGGVTVSSGTVSALDLEDYSTVTGTVLTSGTATIVGDEARYTIRAGVSGKEYKITLLATLSNSDIYEEDLLMRVVNH